MIVEAGHFALILAFALSLAQASAPLDRRAARRSRR